MQNPPKVGQLCVQFNREGLLIVLLGFITTIFLVTAIMCRWLSPLMALTVIPIAGALVGGFGFETFEFAVTGIRSVAPIVGLFMFAILYFGVMRDAGLFDPAISAVIRVAVHNPARITLGTAILATIAHLDGSGASTFLIVIPAMLPLYDRLGMDRRILACIVAMAAGVANMLPWGGPTLRAAASLDIPLVELYQPLIPVQLVGFTAVYLISYYLGSRKIAAAETNSRVQEEHEEPSAVLVHLEPGEEELRRPSMFKYNVLLTAAVIFTLVSGKIAPVIVFMLGLVLALLINYRETGIQKQRIDSHAPSALMMASILIAAGVFTGIMRESGMLNAMASWGAQSIPGGMASFIPAALGFASVPLSLLFDPDSFYFGVLPVLSSITDQYGIAASATAHAALMGQSTVGFPVSPLTPATFLLVGLARLDLAEHQRFTLPWLLAISFTMTITAVIIGVIPL